MATVTSHHITSQHYSCGPHPPSERREGEGSREGGEKTPILETEIQERTRFHSKRRRYACKEKFQTAELESHTRQPHPPPLAAGGGVQESGDDASTPCSVHGARLLRRLLVASADGVGGVETVVFVAGVGVLVRQFGLDHFLQILAGDAGRGVLGASRGGRDAGGARGRQRGVHLGRAAGEAGDGVRAGRRDGAHAHVSGDDAWDPVGGRQSVLVQVGHVGLGGRHGRGVVAGEAVGGGVGGDRRALPEALTVGGHLALAQRSGLASFVAFLALLELGADGGEEGFEMGVEVLGQDAEIPVEEEQQLFLHEIDFREGEAEAFVSADGRVSRPVLVLGGRVVEVLGRQDEGRQEDAVHGAAHALGDGWEARLQSREVDEG